MIYEPAAAAYHSHREGARAQAQRLIDISRVDAAGAPARTRRRTVREAAGLFYRDSSSILGLDEPARPQAHAPDRAGPDRLVLRRRLLASGNDGERRRADS